jgi:hypothetical protein
VPPIEVFAIEVFVPPIEVFVPPIEVFVSACADETSRSTKRLECGGETSREQNVSGSGADNSKLGYTT